MNKIIEFFRPRNIEIQDPPFAKYIFGNSAFSWVWLVVRVWLGWQWLDAGWHKVSDPAWVETGTALQGYWTRAVAIPETGRAPISFDWYRSFIQMLLDGNAHTWFAPVVAYGEVLVGIALIIGAFVGISAFFGAFMNWNFMMAGSASTNPLLFVLALLLILAWKNAGYFGLDRWLLPLLGTPWKVGTLVSPGTKEPQAKPMAP
jgi:thiosulfate dehydrogenase [quinone] large subunit